MIPGAISAGPPSGGDMPAFSGGRRHCSTRRIRLADVDPSGATRFDALARHLQDVATDDVRDAGVEDAIAWVVRRTTIIAPCRPRYGEEVQLATWCSGTGVALAERRTSISGEWGAAVEAVSLWVSLDRSSLRPVPLTGAYFDPYRESAADRRVRARFVHPAAAPEGRPGRPWPLRDSDLDLFEHVNNAVSWMAVEEEAHRCAPGLDWGWGQVEYRRAVGAGETPTVVSSSTPGREGSDGPTVSVWMLGPDGSATTTGLVGGGLVGGGLVGGGRVGGGRVEDGLAEDAPVAQR